MRRPASAPLQARACDAGRGCHPAVCGRADIPIQSTVVAAAPVAHDPFR